MVMLDTQQRNRGADDESALLKVGGGGKFPHSEAALKDTFVIVGTVWLVATLVAIGAYAVGLQLVAVIGVLAMVTMMFAWLAGLCYLVGGWATRRFDVIGALTRGKAGTGTPG